MPVDHEDRRHRKIWRQQRTGEINMGRFDHHTFNIASIDKHFDEIIYSKAKLLRAEMAYKLSRLPIDPAGTDDDTHFGMFDTILERTPFDDTKKVLSFNMAVTDSLCKELLSRESADIVETIALYSCIIELGAREFIAPEDPHSVTLHLSAAKDAGYFFTPASLALHMVSLSVKYDPQAASVFDPACGAGIFLAYYLLFSENVKTLAGVELDERTAVFAEDLLHYIQKAVGREVDITILHGDLFEYFETAKHTARYDAIIMNPPYGNLKFMASDLTDSTTRANVSTDDYADLCSHLREATLERAKRLRCQFSGYGLGKGVLECSKLFMAAALDLLSQTGALVAITPSSWLGDETSVPFRRTILCNGYLREMWMIPEAAKLFKGVNQPTTVSVLRKTYSSDIIVADPVMTLHDVKENSCILDARSILSVSGSKVKFPKCKKYALPLLEKMQGMTKLRDLRDIVNLRGELDLTKYKRFVSAEGTGTRLIRGDHIQGRSLLPASSSEKAGYVLLEGFIAACSSVSRSRYVGSSRIAIPQCSYLNKKKRIEAAIVPRNCVIANSCDFIAVTEDTAREEREFLYWILLNSTVVEWQFRIFSYNNHVGNSELDEVPFIAYDSLSDQEKEHLNELMSASGPSSVHALDPFAAKLFHLSEEEYRLIVMTVAPEESAAFLAGFRELLTKYGETEKIIPQHQIPALSALDKQMIGYVEPGGNWTSIPESVPSKRLDQIRAMAQKRGMVRTTYYSRLKYEQPAYTISTYFNRPGNGANIHPWEDRTLTSREAARLQSFPDHFVFEGNDAAVRTQIGNAVPPLLGYAIGNAIKKKAAAPPPFCDIFAGAGGLSCGLELAGLRGVAALEINKDAAKTFARNHSPQIHTIVGDINDSGVQDELIAAVRAGIAADDPWVLVGGPPCQGFSTAGCRDENDIRNRLVDSYLSLVKRLDPPIVVMENVHGILSMSKGKVIEGIYSSFKELGYVTHSAPWVVDAERYGVPQMRKRVVILAAKDPDLLPEYPEPIFRKCLGRREPADLRSSPVSPGYPVTVGEALYGLPPLMPVNEYYPEGAHIDSCYGEWCMGQIGIEEMLARRSRK